MEATKYVLRYLKHTSSHGIWFKQSENRLQGCCAIPKELQGDELPLFTDSNWGPQDASEPVPNETRTVTMGELKSTFKDFISPKWGVFYIRVSIRKSEVVEVHVWPKSSLSMMD